MHKLMVRLVSGSMALSLWACGGKVVVDAGSGGAGGGGQGGDVSTSSGEPACGDVVLPSPAELTPCGGSVAASGGGTSCELDVCDADNNIFASVCSGSSCACLVNGATKCSCAITGTGDVCATSAPCCPWVPIPL